MLDTAENTEQEISTLLQGAFNYWNVHTYKEAYVVLRKRKEFLSQSLLVTSVSDPGWVLDIQKLGCTHSMLDERHLS